VTQRTDAEAMVAEFGRMQSFLTTMARALTRNPKMQVKLSKAESGASFTDGKTIYITPYKGFKPAGRHDIRLCDERDERWQQKCGECARMEDLISLVFHEMAHIVWASLLEFDASNAPRFDHITWLDDEAKLKIRQDVYAGRITTVPMIAKASGKYMPFLWNALEDIRIEAAMGQIRANTPAMMTARHMSIAANGEEFYAKVPMNAQMTVGLIFAHEGTVDPALILHPKIAGDLKDPFIVQFLGEIHNFADARETYERGIDLYGRLIELGYFEQPKPPEPEPEPVFESDTDDDSPEDEREDSDDNEDAETLDDAGTPGSSGSDDGDSSEDDPSDDEEKPDSGASHEAGDADSGADSTEPDEAPQSQADPDSDGSESGSGTPGEDADPVASELLADEEEVSPDEDIQSSDGDSGDDDDTKNRNQSGDAGRDRDSSEEDVSEEGGSDDLGPDDPESGTGGGTPGEQGDPQAPGFPPDDDAEPLEDERVKGAPGVRDAGPDERADASSDGTDLADDETEAEGGEADADELADESELESSPDGPDQREQEPVDQDFGYTPIPGESADTPDMGDPEDVEALVNAMLGHNNTHEHAPQVEAELADPLTRAEVERLAYKPIEFTGDDSLVNHLTRLVWDGRKWKDKEGVHVVRGLDQDTKLHFKYHSNDDYVPDESIYGKALMELKLTFERNARGAKARNLRSGKINASVLGKRAPLGDGRLFQTKSLPKKRDYVVLLHIDNSGSTDSNVNQGSWGDRTRILEFEKKAVYAQAELLARLGIKFIIMAGNADMKMAETGFQYDMYSVVYEIKSVSEPWDNKVKERLKALPATGFNLDGHAVQIAVWELMQVRATDKVLMYYTDGEMPAANKDDEIEVLTRAIATATKNHITLMGVGVQTNSPSAYGLDTVRIDTADDLSAVTAHLGKRIGLG
jgi:hypothetical protein